MAVLTELRADGEPGDDGAGECPYSPNDALVGTIGGVDSGDGSVDESSVDCFAFRPRVAASPPSSERLVHSG